MAVAPSEERKGKAKGTGQRKMLAESVQPVFREVKNALEPPPTPHPKQSFPYRAFARHEIWPLLPTKESGW